MDLAQGSEECISLSCQRIFILHLFFHHVFDRWVKFEDLLEYNTTTYVQCTVLSDTVSSRLVLQQNMKPILNKKQDYYLFDAPKICIALRFELLLLY